MDSQKIAEKFEALLKPVLKQNGLELIRAEYVKESGNYYLRGFITRPEGDININDCATVSRIMSDKLDKEDFIPDAYTMEICSPGFLENPHTDEINYIEEGEEQ
ncbi:MAG: ribosome maturation factor RimP [Lachnospiraceae bacterium]|nr:ribosome maturation factor RimP [Lachnospiraceae bacterium]